MKRFQLNWQKGLYLALRKRESRDGLQMIKAGVLTISDKGFRGQRRDKSGPLVAEMLTKAGYRVEKQGIVPDDHEKIVESLIE
ncbi:MAG: molybdenum cofactor biosynthesis protein B, partial [Desulfatiglandales bacterium]